MFFVKSGAWGWQAGGGSDKTIEELTEKALAKCTPVGKNTGLSLRGGRFERQMGRIAAPGCVPIWHGPVPVYRFRTFAAAGAK